MFRIQMSTKALSNIVPGGSAAGSALGYRLITLSGVSGPDAGFALGTAGLGSAVVLNLIFWLALMVSIPMRGVNPAYVIGRPRRVSIMVLFAVALVARAAARARAAPSGSCSWLGASSCASTRTRAAPRCARSACAWRS